VTPPKETIAANDTRSSIQVPQQRRAIQLITINHVTGRTYFSNTLKWHCRFSTAAVIEKLSISKLESAKINQPITAYARFYFLHVIFHQDVVAPGYYSRKECNTNHYTRTPPKHGSPKYGFIRLSEQESHDKYLQISTPTYASASSIRRKRISAGALLPRITCRGRTPTAKSALLRPGRRTCGHGGAEVATWWLSTSGPCLCWAADMRSAYPPTAQTDHLTGPLKKKKLNRCHDD
jgi:hypothetical protein